MIKIGRKSVKSKNELFFEKFVASSEYRNFKIKQLFRHETKLLSLMDLWTLAGIGYSIGQFFMMKYVFFYGITRPFMKADGIDPPDHPKCIGTIYILRKQFFRIFCVLKWGFK